MQLVKTLDNGNQVFSVVETEKRNVPGHGNCNISVGYRVEVDKDGNHVRKWEPSFDEIAGHSPASKKFGH